MRQILRQAKRQSRLLMILTAMLLTCCSSDNEIKAETNQVQANMAKTLIVYFAEKVFLSPGYFGDLIKKETGLTAQRYIQNKVIDLSKQYVMDKELTINQVAYKLGFQYPQHFRLFKQQVGVTPTEYRN